MKNVNGEPHFEPDEAAMMMITAILVRRTLPNTNAIEAFVDELQETVDRNLSRRGTSDREKEYSQLISAYVGFFIALLRYGDFNEGLANAIGFQIDP